MSGATHLEHDWFPRALPSNVTLGPRSWCYSAFAFLHYQSQRGVRVGHDSGIYNGTFFDLGPDGEVEIGNYCTLVGAIIATNGRVTIGDYALIAHEVVLGDHDAMSPGSFQRNRAAASSIKIGENCWIGARATILAGVEIGEGAVVGAGAVVRGSIPPYAIAAGNPARVVRTIQHSTLR